MPTVETEDDSEAPELDGGTAATPSTTASSARSAKTTRTVGTMTDGGRTPHFARVKSERTSTTESESEEARVARRRERWRLKKREQRAKMAARLSETQEKVTPVITASAHFLFPHADRGGRAQTQTLRKSTQIAKERPPNGAPPSSLPRRRSSQAQRRRKVKCLSVPSPPLTRRSIPPTDAAGDALEQSVAKQRAYWRIKKREQRAKMSMEAKVRLKEKDSLMRRVRRYRNIVKELRRARAWVPRPGTIGSFIKEDGALSAAGIPRTTPSLGGMAGKDGRAVPAGAPARSSEPPPPRSCSHLTRPQSQRKAVFPAARVARPACVRKMLLSDQSLSEAERLAKKREYWRVTKRQQRAARLRREGARLGPPLQRKQGPRPVSEAPVLNAVKREPDLSPASERGVAPDVKPPLLEPEPDPASPADCPAATTLLAVASMKKLLEESLSTANEVRDQEPGVGAKVKAEPERSEPDMTEVALVVRARYPDGIPLPCPSADGSLQKKREYWKLMKRQQRARQKESQRKAAALAPINVAKTPARVSAALLRAPGNGRPAAEPDPALPTLRAPQNPLSGLTLLLPVRPPAPLKRLWPPGAGPPKRRPEESEEDFVKRKREYWRIKKKEQRARKCVADKGVARGRTCTPPARKLQGFCQRAMPDKPLSDAEGHLVSNWADTGTCSHAAAAPPQGELLGTAERPPGEEGPVSEATWRNTYLMDYEPLDRLLVCVACGELQHSDSLEGVLAHIQEAHPHTRALEPAQRRRILEAWDEQVSRRERFFTSQLQRRHAALAETHRN
ncbi:serine/arginine repetitive matrix protein 1 isoform X2 [Syngnathus acus]|uniref:serine/arginine repetitive matrix protein 1 isoform X2 n=1 Tax=Syngnathus acus TaxID=161584 RepID=UPI0018862228|nr:serine/arginine repetitive matrix protein 1 isoform X2 [Syngnathus acus]